LIRKIGHEKVDYLLAGGVGTLGIAGESDAASEVVSFVAFGGTDAGGAGVVASGGIFGM
jgi:hypothetical protein